MKLEISTEFATALILSAIAFQPGAAWAQADMKDMPGMTQTATPTPKKSPPAETPTPTAGAMTEEEMEAMPGMTPKTTPTPKSAGAEGTMDDMSGMPGMAPAKESKSKTMSEMPGMDHGDKSSMKSMKGKGMDSMGEMPGMATGGTSSPARMSAPGVTILRPPQKWAPPPGDNRASELLSRPALEQFMKPLPPPVGDTMLHSFLLFELLEYRANSAGSNTFDWDFVGWFGGDYSRLWIKTEGSQDLSDGYRGEGDLQLLYGRLIAPFWDFQVGVRGKQNLGAGFHGNSRTYAVIGLQGLAPGNFDVEPAIYISDRGGVSAELTLSADLYLTQRLVLQPRFQGEVSLQGDDRFGTGEGVNVTDIGLRLRYEIRREFAPYIGVSWLHSYGQTARLARQEGETNDTIALVAGLRLWW